MRTPLLRVAPSRSPWGGGAVCSSGMALAVHVDMAVIMMKILKARGTRLPLRLATLWTATDAARATTGCHERRPAPAAVPSKATVPIIARMVVGLTRLVCGGGGGWVRRLLRSSSSFLSFGGLSSRVILSSGVLSSTLLHSSTSFLSFLNSKNSSS